MLRDLFQQIRKILTLVDRRKRWLLVILSAATLLASMLEVVSVTAIFPLLKLLIDPGNMQMPDWARALIEAQGVNRLLLIVCVGIFVVFFGKITVTTGTVWLKWQIQARLYRDVSVRLLASYLSAPLSFHLQHNPAELQRNLNYYVTQLTRFGCLGLIDLGSDVVLAIGIFTALIWIEPWVSLLILVGFLIISALYLRFGQGFFLAWSRQFKQASSKMFQTATEAVTGIKTIKVLGREEFFVREYFRVVTDYADALRRNSFVAALPRQVLELCAVGALVGMLAWTILVGGDPKATIPTLAVFAAAAFRLMPAFVRITNTVQNFRFGHDAIDTIYHDLMNLGESGKRREMPALSDRSFAGAIELRDATFRYAGAAELALAHVTVCIRPGEAVALVGASGAGKTTLADLILGLHKLDSGTLTIDGVEYRSPSEIPRGIFGYVPQDPFLIDDTIARNIALGLPDQDIDAGRLDAAVNASALDSFIGSLPDGLQTIVGDRGVRLSGGQRQRIGIARALYVDPSFLVLDEATSAVDATTEADITAAINRLRRLKTIIVVAHRLSTVQECDRIILMRKGRIVDQGSFLELESRNREFATMVSNLDSRKLRVQTV